MIAERNRHLTVRLVFLVLISLVCFTLMMLSLYFYLSMGRVWQQGLLDDARAQYQTVELIKAKELISQYNGLLATVNTFYKTQVVFSEALAVISKIPNPAGLHIRTITLDHSATGGVRVVIGGSSDTREHLVQFKNTVDTTTGISKAYFPAEDWIKPTDLLFTASFEVVIPNNTTSQ